METLTTDLCVIGGGSGGLSVAAGAVQMGARVVLLEGGRMGGDCLNYGCVPSKALIAAAKAAHAMSAGAPFGVAPAAAQVDFAAVKDHVAEVIAGIAPHDSVERFESLGVRVIRDWGRFVSPREVQAGEVAIRARRYVVATGSSPLVPPIPGLDAVPHFTNETIFDLRERPDHLIVIGGGPVGMEMAQAHRRLGSGVTVIEAARALGRDDPELSAVVLERLRAEGVDILEGATAERVQGHGGAVEVAVRGGQVMRGSHLLIAVGRRPNTERLDLDAAGVRHGRAGIEVGDNLRSTNRRVYAIGDVAGREQFTHAAGHHASVVLRSILFGLPSRLGRNPIPWVTYTDPELAHVGLTEAQARKAHGDAAVTVLRAPFAENDRARTARNTSGMVKLVVVRGRPVGASIAGAQAGELIGFWALAIAARIRLGTLAGTVLPYPTLAEVNKRAAGAYFSPKLFDNPMVKRVVGVVQRVLH
jgi:pyruvate/2-oxoglutarate dehydrogenase complex dihydrolipoamide dehydrogenase (E3) component